MTDDLRTNMWKAMAESPFLMIRLNAGTDHAEPLLAQLDPAAHGKFWFYTSKTNRIAAGGPAMAQFVARDHRLFACIAGTLAHENDPALIDRYWSDTVESWYEGGRTDPTMLMMRFDLREAEIWQPDNSLKGLFHKMTGKGDALREMGSHETLPLG